MKETILTALKAKFEGVSENILSRIAAKLSKTATTEEQAKKAVEDYTLQQVIDSYADSRASEAQQTAVRNYEGKYGLKDGQKVETPQPPQPPTPPKPNEETMPTWAKALYDTIQKQEAELAAFKQGNITTSRKKQLSVITSKLPESTRKGYDRIAVDTYTDEDFTTLLGEVTKEVDAIVAEHKQAGATFGGRSHSTTPGGNAPEATKEEVDAVVSKLMI